MLSQIFFKRFFSAKVTSLLSDEFVYLLKFGPFKCIGSMCIQKLFIIIKMMYSGIKLMVLCIAYHFRMRVSALKSSHEKACHPCSYGQITCPLGRGCAVGRVQLVGSIVHLQTWSHGLLFGLTLSALCIGDSSVVRGNWRIIRWSLPERYVFICVVRLQHFYGVSWGGFKTWASLCTTGCCVDCQAFWGGPWGRWEGASASEWNVALPR